MECLNQYNTWEHPEPQKISAINWSHQNNLEVCSMIEGPGILTCLAELQVLSSSDRQAFLWSVGAFKKSISTRLEILLGWISHVTMNNTWGLSKIPVSICTNIDPSHYALALPCEALHFWCLYISIMFSKSYISDTKRRLEGSFF